MVIFEINEGRCSSNLESNNLQRDIEHVVVVVERGLGWYAKRQILTEQ